MVDGHSEAEVKTDDDGVEYDEKRFVPKGLQLNWTAAPFVRDATPWLAGELEVAHLKASFEGAIHSCGS